MRVLHFQHMGVGAILSCALRDLGVHSRVISTESHPFGFREDFLLPRRQGRARVLQIADWLPYMGYDIFHSHDEYYLPRMAAYRWPDRRVQHYHDPKVRKPLGHPAASLVSLPGITKVITNGIWTPLPVRTDVFKPCERREAGVVQVGFCAQKLDPTKPDLIPVDEVLAAVRAQGGCAQVRPLEGVVDHDRMVDYYRSIDVWVDRIGCGFYGFSAAEAAAVGIPVVTQIGAFERDFLEGCPFVSVDRGGVTFAVEQLIADQAMRMELGERAREYSCRVHDSRVVARQVLGVYERVMKGT